MLQELLSGVLFCKHPVVHFKDTEFRAEELFKVFFTVTVIEHFFRREVAQEFLDIVVTALSGKKLTSGDVEQAESTGCFPKVYGSEEVIFLVVEHVVAHGDAWCDEFCDASLHHFVHLR